MATYVKKKYHRNLSGVDFKIKGVYQAYRAGGIDTGAGYKGKKFYYFPARIPDDVIHSGDERAKLLNGEGQSDMELREQVWNKDEKRFEFWKVKEKLTRDFFSTYKKVFDVAVVIGGDVELPVWDADAKTEVKTTFHAGEELVLSEFPASRVKAIMEAFDIDGKVQLVNGKDKAGNPAKVKPFDWEDGLRGELADKFVKMKVKNEGMDTTYTFIPGKEFGIEEFGSTAPSAPTSAANEPVDVDDIPF